MCSRVRDWAPSSFYVLYIRRHQENFSIHELSGFKYQKELYVWYKDFIQDVNNRPNRSLCITCIGNLHEGFAGPIFHVTIKSSLLIHRIQTADTLIFHPCPCLFPARHLFPVSHLSCYPLNFPRRIAHTISLLQTHYLPFLNS